VPEALFSSLNLVSDDIHYRILRALEANPEITQRELAEVLGMSLGKANYCVRALIEQGWVKAKNFKNSRNKLAYAYLLTPQGLEAKARITYRFLKRKLEEYEALEQEIERLRAEISDVESS
jgi:EPS-associated MarR family transcriptional regulator